MGLFSSVKDAVSKATGVLDPATKAFQTIVGGGSAKSAAGQFFDPLGITGHNPSGLLAPNTTGADREKALASYLQKEAAPLIKAGESGKLTKDQQATVDAFRRGATAQSRLQLAKMGLSESTTAVEAANQIDATAREVTNNFLQTDLQQGLAYLGAAEGDTAQFVMAQTAANEAMGQAFGSMSSAIGSILGSGANTSTTTPPAGTY